MDMTCGIGGRKDGGGPGFFKFASLWVASASVPIPRDPDFTARPIRTTILILKGIMFKDG